MCHEQSAGEPALPSRTVVTLGHRLHAHLERRPFLTEDSFGHDGLGGQRSPTRSTRSALPTSPTIFKSSTTRVESLLSSSSASSGLVSEQKPALQDHHHRSARRGHQAAGASPSTAVSAAGADARLTVRGRQDGVRSALEDDSGLLERVSQLSRLGQVGGRHVELQELDAVLARPLLQRFVGKQAS